jgi:hypothetical protein
MCEREDRDLRTLRLRSANAVQLAINRRRWKNDTGARRGRRVNHTTRQSARLQDACWRLLSHSVRHGHDALTRFGSILKSLRPRVAAQSMSTRHRKRLTSYRINPDMSGGQVDDSISFWRASVMLDDARSQLHSGRSSVQLRRQRLCRRVI